MRPVVTAAEMARGGRRSDADAARGAGGARRPERSSIAASSRCCPASTGPGDRAVRTGVQRRGRPGGRAPPRGARREGDACSTRAAPPDASSPTSSSTPRSAPASRGRWDAPGVPASTPVLAVDIPSGVDPDTGLARGSSLAAARTVASVRSSRGTSSATARCSRVDCGRFHRDQRRVAGRRARGGRRPRAACTAGRARAQVATRGLCVAGSRDARRGGARRATAAFSVPGGMVRLVRPRRARRREGPFGEEVGPAHRERPGRAPRWWVTRSTGRARSWRGRGSARPATRARGRRDPQGGRASRSCSMPTRCTSSTSTSCGRAGAAARPDRAHPPRRRVRARSLGAPPARTASRRPRAASRTGCTVLLKGPTTVVASHAAARGAPALVVTSGSPDLATRDPATCCRAASGRSPLAGLPRAPRRGPRRARPRRAGARARRDVPCGRRCRVARPRPARTVLRRSGRRIPLRAAPPGLGGGRPRRASRKTPRRCASLVAPAACAPS